MIKRVLVYVLIRSEADPTVMSQTIKLSRLQQQLESLSYPIDADEAADSFADTTVTFADGDADLGTLIGKIDADRFESAEGLYSDLNNVLPIEALGEPGQSDGDA